MLEEVWPEIGTAWVTGVLAGGGSVLVQWLAPRAARLLKRLRAADNLRLERRLAAILAADVVGYSGLMSADEEGTHFRLLAQFRPKQTSGLCPGSVFWHWCAAKAGAMK
jgi:hypothetical protein